MPVELLPISVPFHTVQLVNLHVKGTFSKEHRMAYKGSRVSVAARNKLKIKDFLNNLDNLNE